MEIEYTLIPMDVDTVSMKAVGYPDQEEWLLRIAWDTVNLIVPNELVDKVNAVDTSVEIKKMLKQYAGYLSQEKRDSGIVSGAYTFKTDASSRAELAVAALTAQFRKDKIFKWKLEDNNFVDLNASDIIDASEAASDFVSAVQTTEYEVQAKIDSGVYTKKTHIDAAFGVTSTSFHTVPKTGKWHTFA
jgi:hypothetical protein